MDAPPVDTVAKATEACSESARSRYNRAVVAIQRAKELVAELAADDEIGAFLLATEATGHLHQAIQYLLYARPDCLCRHCDGNGVTKHETCFHCKGHGWLPAGVAKHYG